MRAASGSDVLIVGAGSAGSVLAERLSADPDCQVRVVEAGPDRADPAVRALTDRAASLPIGPDSPVARRYRSALTVHPPIHTEIVRGRCLGGSGAINGGYFCRALPADVAGLPAGPRAGWTWAEVEPHYRAVEARIGIELATEFAVATTAFTAAAQQAGYRWLPALSADADGIGAVPLNIVDGVRIGPGAAFLEPARDRANLDVLTGIRVDRVLVADGRAIGVEGVGADGPVRFHADAVVLSAGAVESARLLMLSGIGPADGLAALDIPVLVDLPVGRRCWDHPEWVMPAGWAGASGHPVLEVVLVERALEIRPYTTGFGAPTTSVGVALMRPRSRGRVSLASADPDVAPRIEHRYDSEPADVADLARGCELVRGILRGTTELGKSAWSTSQHLCGTAPMGVDDGAVVDPQCRVRGVAGLSVVDGSVLPNPLGRGPHATIAMLAHRAAEFVR